MLALRVWRSGRAHDDDHAGNGDRPERAKSGGRRKIYPYLLRGLAASSRTKSGDGHNAHLDVTLLRLPS